MRRFLMMTLAFLSIFGALQIARAADIEVVVKDLHFPEGPIFVGNVLYFVDYTTSDVLRWVGGKVETVWHGDDCGPNGLVKVADGLAVTCYRNNTISVISITGEFLRAIDKDDAGLPFSSPNDLAADAKGGIYFTGSGPYNANQGKVYYLAADQTVKEVAQNLRYANGLVVSLDGKTLYVAQTEAGDLISFSVAADGTLSNKREFVKFADILTNGNQTVYGPDGVRLDKHGNLFVGFYDGGGFAIVAPDGKLIKQIDLPSQHNATLAISPDGKFVYSTGLNDTADKVHHGMIFRVRNPIAE